MRSFASNLPGDEERHRAPSAVKCHRERLLGDDRIDETLLNPVRVSSSASMAMTIRSLACCLLIASATSLPAELSKQTNASTRRLLHSLIRS
jgi:hypothetical protein